MNNQPCALATYLKADISANVIPPIKYTNATYFGFDLSISVYALSLKTVGPGNIFKAL